MKSYKRALEKFIDSNEQKLIDGFFKYCQFNVNSDAVKWINGDLAIMDTNIFTEWVEEKYASEINALEDQLKDESKSLSEQSREYANQVMADYKLAQTGKY